MQTAIVLLVMLAGPVIVAVIAGVLKAVFEGLRYRHNY